MDDDIPETYSRFSRTLAEAFPREHADPIERHGPTGYPPAWWAALGIIGALALTIAWVTR